MPKINRSLDHQTANDNSTYEVENILAKRKLPSGKYEYLCKWKNYKNSANSFEPYENLSKNAQVYVDSNDIPLAMKSKKKNKLTTVNSLYLTNKKIINDSTDYLALDNSSDSSILMTYNYYQSGNPQHSQYHRATKIFHANSVQLVFRYFLMAWLNRFEWLANGNITDLQRVEEQYLDKSSVIGTHLLCFAIKCYTEYNVHFKHKLIETRNMSIVTKWNCSNKYTSVLQYVRDLLLYNINDGNQFDAGAIKAIMMYDRPCKFLKHPLGKYVQFSDSIGKRRITHLQVDSRQVNTYDMLQKWME